MAGDLLTLPLRIGVRTTLFFWRVAEGVAERAVSGALQLAHVFGTDGAPTAVPETEPAVSAEPPPERSTTPRRRPAPADTAAASGPPAPAAAPIISGPVPAEQPPPPAPAHVSEEPVLVREDAEPGAEQGAGAEVRIDPPWAGYDAMRAREVIARLADASAAELAAVQLYETSKRSRQTVLAAVARQLKAANGRG
jgi:hypothetical protein